MKPDRKTAMRILIKQVRDDFPFSMPEAQICAGKCVGCPKKLLELVDTELSDWEYRLGSDVDEMPTFADIRCLAKLCTNVRRGLVRNGLYTNPIK